MRKNIKEMSLKELEQEARQNKSITQMLVEREIRNLDINGEIIKRLKEKITNQNKPPTGGKE